METSINKFKLGEKNGYWEEFFQKSEKLRCRGHYSMGVRNGYWAFYHSNGNIKKKGNYEVVGGRNIRKGYWRNYDKSGILISDSSYNSRGCFDGVSKQYDKNGNIVSEIMLTYVDSNTRLKSTKGVN